MLNKISKFFGMPLAAKVRYFQNLSSRIYFLCFIRPFLRSCGEKAFIFKPLYLTPEYVSLGHNAFIMPAGRIEGISSYNDGDSYRPNITIEDGVCIQQRCHITAASNILIGKNTLISFDVSIQDTDHEYQAIDTPVASQPLSVKETQIGENCFIGSGVKIQAGTILGKQCIVGANAVVRGVFPDYCVIVGAPAKIIKRYNPVSGQWQKTNSDGEFISDL